MIFARSEMQDFIFGQKATAKSRSTTINARQRIPKEKSKKATQGTKDEDTLNDDHDRR